MSINESDFGQMPDGQGASLFTLTNVNGAVAKITNYGGIVTELWVPDKHGRLGDVVLGFDTLEGYLSEAYTAANPYLGCIVGRFANRIANGRFTLDGTRYTLAVNNGPNHLHGGIQGFDKVLWQGQPVESDDGVGVRLRYLSPDGQEGYPGSLEVTVLYTLTDDNALRIDYAAATDKPTICNLTHHGYFNLAGQGSGDILGHALQIHADHFTPIDSTLNPTGDIRPVKGTPLDFTTPTAIGDRIDADHEQLRLAQGYDHNWVLNKSGDALSPAATVYERSSGRSMEVWTTEPGMQFYSANFLDGTLTGKDGKAYLKRHAFCLETQHFPDSPNKPGFPSCVLRPGQKYKTTTVFKFSTP